MTTNLIEARGITHDYGSGDGALDINFMVKPGEVVGFIGPNGAGKTTTMRMLMGFITSQSGGLNLFGSEVNSEQERLKVMPKIGFLPAEPAYYSGYNSNRLFKYIDRFYAQDTLANAKEMADKLGLNTRKKVMELSTGNQRKLGIVLALMHQPDLVILDEPTSGLDPLVQQKVLTLVSDVKNRGGAVFLSSHVLSEVEQVCDRIVMIKNGRIIMDDSTEEVLAKALKRFRIRDLSKEVATKLKKMKAVDSVNESAADTIVYVTDAQPVLDLLIKENIFDFYLERPTLEEMFLYQYA